MSARTIPLSYVMRNLWVRRVTTVLTAGGMSLVVFVFATVLMMSEGIRATLVATGHEGNLIVLRHQSQYTTWYGHLSGFAKGLRKGKRVMQGEVIGFVGATGLATGPHLHYEFRINDVHQNPLRVAMPAAPPITPELKPKFDQVSRQFVERLGLLRTTNLARLD